MKPVEVSLESIIEYHKDKKYRAYIDFKQLVKTRKANPHASILRSGMLAYAKRKYKQEKAIIEHLEYHTKEV